MAYRQLARALLEHERRRRHRWLSGRRARPAGQAGALLDAGRSEARRRPDRLTGHGAAGPRPRPRPGPRPAGRQARPLLRGHAGRRAGAGPLDGHGAPTRSRRGAALGGLLIVRLGEPGGPRRVPGPAVPVRRLAPEADLRPVDDLPGLPPPDLDQRDAVPVIRAAARRRADGRSATGCATGWVSSGRPPSQCAACSEASPTRRGVGLAAPLPRAHRLRAGRIPGLRRGRA